MYIILLGGPGAGKGTQAVNLARKLGLMQVAAGDLFRQALEKKTGLGLQAKVYMEKGKLVPNEITIKMILDRISVPDCKAGVVFDGFPRNITQAEALDKAMAERSTAIDKVVYIKVPEEALMKRLGGRWICRDCQAPYHETDSPPAVAGKCDRCGGKLYQRGDDTAETIKQRLKVYFAETAPLIDYYTRAGKLLEINGQGSIDEVGRRLISALKQELK